MGVLNNPLYIPLGRAIQYDAPNFLGGFSMRKGLSINWVAGPDCPGQVPSNFGALGVPETSLDPTDQRDNVSHFTDV